MPIMLFQQISTLKVAEMKYLYIFAADFINNMKDKIIPRTEGSLRILILLR